MGISDRDTALRGMAAGYYPAEATVGQVMSTDILYCRDTDKAIDVLTIVTESKVKALAVLDANKRLVGVIALEDLSKIMN